MTKPDTVATVSVFLTSEELGSAFAERDDEAQAEILRAIVRAFCDRGAASMQAIAIGQRLFGEVGQYGRQGTTEAVEFLRTILESFHDEAQKAATLSTTPPAL